MELIDALFQMALMFGVIAIAGLLLIGLIIAVVVIAYFFWGNWDN